MKFAIFFVLLALPLSVRAQITLEHSYSDSSNTFVDLIEIDSGLWKYISYSKADSLTVFNIDHSFDRTISLPNGDGFFNSNVYVKSITRHLFDHDDQLEVLIHGLMVVRVYKEDGTIEFNCDSCALTYGVSNGATGLNWNRLPIFQTNHGAKMLLYRNDRTNVYSLPGKLPGGSNTAHVTSSSSAVHEIGGASSAYPNPASSQVRIQYELPQGASSGEVILTDETGREVKRYRVTNAFSDLLIDGSALPNGSYFYRVVTSNGAGASQKFEVVK